MLEIENVAGISDYGNSSSIQFAVFFFCSIYASDVLSHDAYAGEAGSNPIYLKLQCTLIPFQVSFTNIDSFQISTSLLIKTIIKKDHKNKMKQNLSNETQLIKLKQNKKIIKRHDKNKIKQKW